MNENFNQNLSFHYTIDIVFESMFIYIHLSLFTHSFFFWIISWRTCKVTIMLMNYRRWSIFPIGHHHQEMTRRQKMTTKRFTQKIFKQVTLRLYIPLQKYSRKEVSYDTRYSCWQYIMLIILVANKACQNFRFFEV